MRHVDALDPTIQPISRSRLAAGWPLVAAIICGGIGVPLAGYLHPGSVAPSATAVLLGLAIAASLPTLAVVLRRPGEPASFTLAGVTAAAAMLLALAPFDPSATAVSVVDFALVAPWRYALPPLVVHFALDVGWSHRRNQWIGWVTGWYAIQAGMLIAAGLGLAMDERPLFDAIDGTVRILVLEPAGAVAALVATLAALAVPTRGPVLRRALLWVLAAIACGWVPLLLIDYLPLLATPLDGPVTPARLALVMLPVFAATATLALPWRDTLARDFAALRAALPLLAESDIEPAVRQIAALLRHAFDARSVLLRIAEPRVIGTAGDVAPDALAAALAREIETTGNRREIVLPIGRGPNPLGDVRLEARHPGAFELAEREWLVGFLYPIATVLHARRRDAVASRHQQAYAAQVDTAISDLADAAHALPPGPTDAGMAIPPPVDAREVLAQLSDGVTHVAEHGEGLLHTTVEARDRARSASDAIARALDGLAVVATQVNQLVRHGEEIAANNDTVSGVAFRTNLVANNAALEARRAGAAGRTFGVLAEEVRRLADTTAATSVAIAKRTGALARDAHTIATALDANRDVLAAAIREAEAGESAAQRLNDAATALEDAARSLRPAVAEANAVAKRRSARDEHLTATLDHFLAERAALTRALIDHHDAMVRLAETLRAFDRPAPR